MFAQMLTDGIFPTIRMGALQKSRSLMVDIKISLLCALWPRVLRALANIKLSYATPIAAAYCCMLSLSSPRGLAVPKGLDEVAPCGGEVLVNICSLGDRMHQ